MRYLSLFSGMECAWQAWHPLGWECAAVAEIDPRACELLAHRLPHVPNLGSVTDITDEDIAALGRLDVVIGGSPCQDLSVAGKRAGLVGARSGLFHEQLRIFHAARHLCGARWLVWENVPGAFSSNRGRDFAVVVGDMAGLELAVPRDGWGTEGVAVGEHGLVEWSVLDAQWFGVAQRRRRVFAVLDTGNWTDRAPVLLERDSLRGDSPPRREAREGIAAAVAPGAGDGGPQEPAGAGTLATGGGGRAYPGTSAQDAGKGFLIAMAHGQGGAEIAEDGGAPCLTCNHEAPIVAHTLRGDGFDASEDGTGRGVPVGVDVYNGAITGDVAATMGTRGSSVNATGPQVLAFSCKDHGADAGDIRPTLRSMGHDGSHANAGGQVAVAYPQGVNDGELDDRTLAGAEGLPAGAVREVRQPEGRGASQGRRLAQQRAGEPGAAVPELSLEGTPPEVAMHGLREAATGAGVLQQALHPIQEVGGSHAHEAKPAHTFAVRRLTPRECERLQGVEDDWTLVPSGKKGKPMADGPRYKMLGNSFARPVITWIGQQIERATKQSAMERAA